MKKCSNLSKDDKEYYGYYDGIPEKIKEMSLEELEKAIEEEKKKCDEMNKKARS